MKSASVSAILAISVGLALGSTCSAADTAGGVAKVREDASSLGHSVAAESKSLGHSVAEKSRHAGHAIADTARRMGLDVKAGALKVKAAFTHDGSGPKD